MNDLGLPMKKSRLYVVNDIEDVSSRYVVNEEIDGTRYVHSYVRTGGKNLKLLQDTKERKLQSMVRKHDDALNDWMVLLRKPNKTPTELRKKQEQNPEKKAERIESLQKEMHKRSIEKMDAAIGLANTEVLDEESDTIYDRKYRKAVTIRRLCINTN